MLKLQAPDQNPGAALNPRGGRGPVDAVRQYARARHAVTQMTMSAGAIAPASPRLPAWRMSGMGIVIQASAAVLIMIFIVTAIILQRISE